MVWNSLRCTVQLGVALACWGIVLGRPAAALLEESEEPVGVSIQQVWELGEEEGGGKGDRCDDDICVGPVLELNHQWSEPLLLAAPENLDPDLTIRGLPFFYFDAGLLPPIDLPPSVDRGPNPLMPPPPAPPASVPVSPSPIIDLPVTAPPAVVTPEPVPTDSLAEEEVLPTELEKSPEAVADSEPPELKEPREPFFTLENIQIDLDDDFSNSGQGSGIFEPVFQGRLRDGTPVQFSTGFNVFDEPNFAKLINIPLRFGYEETIEGIPVDIVGGIDFFDRLSPAPSLSTKATIPLGQKAVLSWALDYGPYKFNVETLENQISAFRYGPSLFWQIDEQTTLFSNVTWGRYSDSNREQQSFSRLERRFGEEFALAANLFNWRYRQNIGAASGYFTPSDFLVYSFEGAWEKPIFDFLKCRLAANVGRQHAGGSWSRAYGYDAVCTVSLNRALEFDIGYGFSNTIDRDTGESASNSREISSQVRMRF